MSSISRACSRWDASRSPSRSASTIPPCRDGSFGSARPRVPGGPPRGGRRRARPSDRAHRACPSAAALLRPRERVAFRALGEGRLDEGERLAEDMLEVGSESGQPDTLVWMAAHVGMLWEEGRRSDEAEALYSAAATVLPTAKAIFVRTLAELGEVDRARDLLELTGDGFPAFPDDFLWSFGMTSLAGVGVAPRRRHPRRVAVPNRTRISGRSSARVRASMAPSITTWDCSRRCKATTSAPSPCLRRPSGSSSDGSRAALCRTWMAWADVVTRRAPMTGRARARHRAPRSGGRARCRAGASRDPRARVRAASRAVSRA